MKKGIAGLLLCFALFSLDAQEQEDPVVAVVLAGGGALGFAHVGALKVLEEEGIRPDMVIGASIGSIVGGLYSVGYSPGELEEIIRVTDWKHTFTDSFDRSKMSFDQKKREADYNLSLAIREKNRVKDIGLSHAQHVVELLDGLLAPYAVETDFDSLPIPFRAIGTDLMTGEKIVYGQGDLKTAIRASMAVPGIFTPVAYRGRYVIDGGWAENLPTTVAEELGADIIIAVSLFSLEEDPEKLSSFQALSWQSELIRTLGVDRKSHEAADLIISPDLTGFNLADFEKGEPLMALGYEAASAMREEIRALAASMGDPLPEPVRRTGDDTVVLGDISVETGGDEVAAARFRVSLISRIGNQPSLSALREALYGFYDTGDYTHVWYQLIPAGDGSYDLVVDAPLNIRPQELFSTSVDFVDYLEENDASEFTLKTSYQRWLGEDMNTSAAFELWVSGYPSVMVSLDHHVLGRYFHIKGKGFLLQRAQYFFEDESVDAVYGLNRTGMGAFMERPFFRRFSLSLGGYAEHNWTEHRLGMKHLAEENWNRYGLRGVVDVDTLDRIIAPRNGLNVAALLDSSVDEEGDPLGTLHAAGEIYFSPVEGFVLIPKAESRNLLWGEFRPVEVPTLGEILLIDGYYPQELRGENALLVGLGIRQKVGTLPLGLGNEIYVQLAGNTAVLWDEEAVDVKERDFDVYSGGSLGVVIHSMIGEVQVSFSMNEEARWSTFLGLSTTTSFFSEFY